MTLVAVAALALAAAANAKDVAVVVVPPFPLEQYAAQGAVGLLVPGSGEAVSRADALEALGIAPSSRPAATTIYVSLPPKGRRPNDRRYPIAVVGDGFHGVLESDATRLPGLVGIDDIAPAAAAIASSRDGPIDATSGTADDVRRLDVRLRDQLRARNGAAAILALSALAFCLLALALSSGALARAGLLASPVTVAVAVVLSAIDVTRPAALLSMLAALTVGLSLLGGVLLDARGVAVTLVVLIAAYLVVLVAKPAWPALAAIGPNPAQAGRFYGSTNTTTSIVLAVGLFAAGTLGRRSLPAIALLSIVTIGWSEAGADGGGIVVLVSAFTVLWILLSSGRLTLPRRPRRGRPRRRRWSCARRPRCRHGRLEPRHATGRGWSRPAAPRGRASPRLLRRPRDGIVARGPGVCRRHRGSRAARAAAATLPGR